MINSSNRTTRKTSQNDLLFYKYFTIQIDNEYYNELLMLIPELPQTIFLDYLILEE